MWRFVVFACLMSWGDAQRGRGPRQSGHNGHGWDIRLAVPGEPGSDYPTLGAIPRTGFSCAGKDPGYYADLETNCQVFRICTTGSTYGFQSFLCPNGTLFNQAVFVCDWWMNVNCQISQELFNSNSDKFGNLRLGPQLMKDVKKMLTHPMRNPYDKTVMKSNLIVMQDYRPPSGQMFPNGALIAPDRPNSIYVSAKKVQGFNPNAYGNAFAASTPSSQYVPPFNTISTQGDAEVFQRQRQNGQFVQNGRIQTQQSGNLISNGHAGQFTQAQNTFFNNGNSGALSTQINRAQYTQKASYSNTQVLNGQTQRGQLIRQNAQYTDNRTPQLTNGKQSEYGISFSKQQYHNSNQENQAYTNKAPQPFTNQNIGQVNNEAQQNLVSNINSNNNIPAPIATKTLTVNRLIQDPKPGNPKSRITFKTWIVKPSKAARLIVQPTPYTYDRPTQPPAQKLVNEPTPYVYNPPKTTSQTARIVAQPDAGYVYNQPTAAAKQIASTVREPSRLYLNPTAPPPTLSGQLYLEPSTARPTIASRLYIAPTTYKPAANLYIPPSQANLVLSRQYLVPSMIQQPAYYQSEQLRSAPTSPSPVFAASPNENVNNPSFTLTKQSRINANHNNLTFADILTKEKLDITVNDIVLDTSKVLKTAAPQFGQYREDKSLDYSEDNYLTSDNNESDENLTPQSPTVGQLSTSARLTAPAPDLSRDLEPPIENYHHNINQNTNPLSSLPFYKEPATNTIERTVSLKISIPEKVAAYLFKSRNESDYDKLEILNTGSSNYLVLTNNLLSKNSGASFIPIGRLIADKNTNISNSQALVFSILADSLNAAKEYSNIAQQNVIPTTPAQQYQNVNNEDISQITNKISQLTASQYTANNHNFDHANVAPATQTITNANQYRAAKYTDNSQNQPQQIRSGQINSVPSQTSQGYPPRLQNGVNSVNANLQSGNQIYSGQLYRLPVPDVTSQIYNAGPNILQDNRQTEAPHIPNQSSPNNNLGKQSGEVEVVPSRPLPVPAKLQVAPNEESFNSQEHSAQALNFVNNGNGISAQLQDKIVGTIPHPSENKLVTYKKDQSYFVYTNLNDNNGLGNVQSSSQTSDLGQNAKLTQNNIAPNIVSFQFVPSVSYQLEDEREQQKILNAFQIDEFGNPKRIQNQNAQDISANVNYSIDHPTSAKQLNGQYNDVNTIYTGPSSYSAPQSSVGSLETRDRTQNNEKARLEQLDENINGYAKVTPARQFTF